MRSPDPEPPQPDERRAPRGASEAAGGPQEAKCPNCRTKIQKRDGEYLFLKNAIIKVDLQTRYSYAKCPRCKIWVSIPLTLERPPVSGAAEPHGGRLVSRVLMGEAQAEARGRAAELPAVSLNARTASDLLLIAVGAYSPLEGFMGQADYESVIARMRLASGLPWPIPVTLAVDGREAGALRPGTDVALSDPRGELLGLLHLQEVYPYDRDLEALHVYRTDDQRHPGVSYLAQRGDTLLGGPVDLVSRPRLRGFERYTLDPAETRALIAERGWRTIVGFQTSNPLNRAHEYIQKCALELMDGLLIHPLVGRTRLDEIPSEVRLRCYRVLIEQYYPRDRVLLAVFPGAMRYAGPREAVFHALIRQNYGCTHFIVGRDHAGVGRYYGPLDAHRIFEEFEPGELKATPLFFEQTFHCRRCGAVASAKTCPHEPGEWTALSGDKLRELLSAGSQLPEELTRPEVAAILADWATGQ